MAFESALVLDGNLTSDGTIRLDRPPDVPAGRVRITLQPLPASVPEAVRLPDGPWLDDAISAPCDLPFSGRAERVHPRQASDLLPDPLTLAGEDLG
jgi:hypothetical protein